MVVAVVGNGVSKIMVATVFAAARLWRKSAAASGLKMLAATRVLMQLGF